MQLRTGTKPGARLHALTVGIDDYGTLAQTLRLHYAAADARDVANALDDKSQGSLYAKVVRHVLLNGDATKAGIFQALDDMRQAMSTGGGSDVAVVMVSGHGGMVDGKFYLLPYGVDPATPARLEASALSGDELRDRLQRLGEQGRVLVLLDACHSGAAAGDGVELARNAEAMRAELAMTNVTVLTSSSGAQVSMETKALGHGVFTAVLLKGLAPTPTPTGTAKSASPS